MMGTSVDSNEAVVETSTSNENTFEAFVKNAIQKIQREAWGRGAEVTEIRNACQGFLGHTLSPSHSPNCYLDFISSEEGSAKMGVPFDEQRTRAVRLMHSMTTSECDFRL